MTPKRSKGGEASCPWCGCQIRGNQLKRSGGCSEHTKSKMKEFFKLHDWLNGEPPQQAKLPTVIRVHLLEQAGYACLRCGFNTNHPDDGKTILEINHIDGNGMNHQRENLEVICPNCHALTSTYRGRNVGNGRPVKYLRIET